MIPQGILFDLDNTLAHRDLGIASYACRFELDFRARLIDCPVHAIAALIVERDNGGYGVADSPFATLREDIASALAIRLRWREAATPAELLSHWIAHSPLHAVEMPGASALMDRLDVAGIAVGIVSNGMESSRRALVQRLGFDRRTRTLVSSERAGARKPDPRIFELACTELDVPAKRCWFVGGHPVNDIAGARAAGLHPVWLAGFHAWPQDGIAAATTIAALSEIEALLRSPVETRFTNP